MTLNEQLADFNAFALQLAQTEGQDIAIDHAYDRWWDQQHRDEDLAAIKAAVRDYENGARGKPALEVIEQFRQERAAAKKS